MNNMYLEINKNNTITTDNVPHDFSTAQDACDAAYQHSATMTLRNAKWYGTPLDVWVRHVVSLHFDPCTGSRYWLQKEKESGINARKDILSFEDLRLFGPMDEKDLRKYPLEYFIPQFYLKNKDNFILGETAGTTGLPKVTAYLKEEFAVIFVDWFRYIAEKRGFPKKANWLWAGPGGPHIIGKAVCPVANSMESMDPFSIDLDPRWLKKMNPESLGYKRYIRHIIEQALDVIRRQHIEVLYTTPPLLERLGEEMNKEQRMRIRGVHYGGVAIQPEQYKNFRDNLFPNAVHIAGYGNTLFGLCMELEESENGDLEYFPPGPRMIVQCVSTKDGMQPGKNRLSQIVEYGEKGQVVCHRLDESFFIPNMFERDEAVRIAPTKTAQSLGIFQDGVKNPSLLTGLEANTRTGVY
ncbi:MAG: hypothetical protein E3K37_08540 [Candidatus Kuenenia sp.]|nr:hypothetical protein [Candidatus Kuenenia hertensis]